MISETEQMAIWLKQRQKLRRPRLNARWIKIALALIGVLLAAALIYRLFTTYNWGEIIDSTTSIPTRSIVLATFFAALSYFCLTWFDWLALQYVDAKIPYPNIALASFVALSLGHNIGFAALSSGAIRYRFYSRWGVSAGDAAKIVLFCGITVGLGLIILAGWALLLQPDLSARLVGISPSAALAFGGICLSAGAGYLLLSIFARKLVRFRKWTLEMPSPRLALAQTIIGPLNFACVAACLYFVLAGVREVSYFEVAAVYVTANAASLVAHAPGGIGVLETTITYLIPGTSTFAALILFRAIYYLLPLSFGVPLFAIAEITLRKRSRS